MSKRSHIILACCAVFFCTASVFAQASDSCYYWRSFRYKQPQTPEEYKEQYDTLRLYIEGCAATDDQSWDVFVKMTGAVQFMSDDTTRFDPYRTWLISVLYLNTTNPAYFCACMGAIMETFQYGKYKAIGTFTVEDYLWKYHPDCFGAGESAQYTKDSAQLSRLGYDVLHLPPLDSLGLGFLLKAGVVSPSTQLSTQYLASFTSSPNPFMNETSVEFTLNRMSYVTLAIYDELGRLVWGYPGSSLEAGMHTVQIDGAKLPSGTLYARISTGFGEVKTVKLEHEK